MIEDKELRELFKAESGEHLQSLETGLLRLEKEPADKPALETVFREAHSLKGSARMLGVRDVERIAHRIEDMLGGVRKGDVALSAEYLDLIYKGLDAVKKLVHEAVTGDPAGVDVGAMLDILAGNVEVEKTNEMPPPATASQVAPKPQSREEMSGEPSSEPREEYRIDTIRVETKKLDELMTQSGELTVMRTRMVRLLSQVEEIAVLGEATVKQLSGEYGAGFNGGNKHNASLPGGEQLKQLVVRLKALRDAVDEDNSRLEFISGALDGGIRDIRLLPFSTLFNFFPRMVRDMARERSKDVDIELLGGDSKADKRIIEEMKDPIMHIIRNSIDHGIEPPQEREKANKPRTGKIRLSARRTDTNIIVEAADDGGGLDIELIKKTAIKRNIRSPKELEAMSPAEIINLIFTPGFSTSAFVTDVSGRGIGLDVVRANVDRLKGSIHVESSAGAGCLFRIRLPITLATARVLLVSANGATYAVPLESVDTTRRVFRNDIFPMEGRNTIVVEKRTVPVAKLADILGLPKEGQNIRRPQESGEAPMPCILLSASGERFGILVDDLLDEQEVVLKPQSAVLKRVCNVAGTTILGSGEICTVLNPDDMLKTMRKRSVTVRPEAEGKAEERKLTVLLVEDSITTRTQEKRILESGGYEVVTSVNGVDALSKLAMRPFDAVVSDIMMPEMDGLTLTARIRQDKKYKELPVILVTTLASDEDKKRGLEAGASAYIPKPSFDQKILLEILGRLV